ncbi:MAG: phosphate ABC transporter permease subunit PstC [bacterium]
MSVEKKQGPLEKGSALGKQRADLLFKTCAAACAWIIVLIMVLMAAELIWSSRLSISEFGFNFLISDAWNPVADKFGALTSIFGTIVSTALAMLIAVPLSIVTALFLSELAPPALSRPVGACIELLAAIPSIIYGMWGLFVIAPLMADHVQPFFQERLGFLPLFQGPPMGIGMFTAGLILALMILPFITSVSRDVINMVPAMAKESGFGMGATSWEVTRKVTIPYGLQGIVGACFLGLARAIGETMAVTFVIGNTHRISASLFKPANSIASTLANEFTEASDPLYLSSLIELGLVLFLITVVIQFIAHFWLKRIKLQRGSGL